MILTKAQRRAVKDLFERSPDGAKTYREFRKRAHYGIPFGDHIMILWCHMWVGIEKDGHTHT